MTTSSIIIPDASTLAVDTSCIDVSEVESQEDKDFLHEKGENILRIVAKAALEVGQQLVEIQERFKTEDPRGTGLTNFYESLQLTRSQCQRWSNKYRAYVSYCEIFGAEGATEKFNELGDRAASSIWLLPTEYREAFFSDIAADNVPTEKTVLEVSRRPEVKLTKAEELLAAAKLRKQSADEKWEMVKADPEITYKDPEYEKTYKGVEQGKNSIAIYEKRIVELQQQIEAERLERAEEEKNRERVLSALEKDLQKLKFDDANVKAERVKKLSTTLTVSLPQALADVSKFFAEIDQYPEDVREHIYNTAKALANQIADSL
jgi:hypothetical protein